jgi:cysteine desulfuration protein SufE
MTSLDQIIDDFAFLDEWEDRYRYVIELGKNLPEMPEASRTSENKVQGCASQVWLVTHATGDTEDPLLTFE